MLGLESMIFPNLNKRIAVGVFKNCKALLNVFQFMKKVLYKYGIHV